MIIGLIFIVYFFTFSLHLENEDCCPLKSVGGTMYKFVEHVPEEQRKRLKCSNTCAYEHAEKDSDVKYCFKPGKLESSCEEADMDCFEYKIDYWGGDMPGNPRKGVPSPRECQKYCQKTPGCNFFTTSPNGDCYLKYSDSKKKSCLDCTSGPRECDPTTVASTTDDPITFDPTKVSPTTADTITTASEEARDCNVRAEDRQNCGYPKITKEACEANGCCWNSNVVNANWCFTPKYQGVTLITGGTDRKSVEIYNPTTKASCSLPLFSEVRLAHSQNHGLTCGGGINTLEFNSSSLTNCVRWNPASRTWDQFAELKEPRIFHVSWETASGVYLIGGDTGSKGLKTSEIVGTDGSSEFSFALKYPTRQSCAIPEPYEVIITGGGDADVRKIVSVYTEAGWQRDFTPLNVGRAMHACGSYVKGGKKVYLVSGGVTIFNGNPGIGVDSTEVYSDNTWRLVGKLQKKIWGMSATTLDNKVLLFGGRPDSDSNIIQEFNPETEEWSVIGAMEQTRRHNRVSVVSFVNYKKWCN